MYKKTIDFKRTTKMSDINFLKEHFDSLKVLIDKEEYLENPIKVKKFY